MNEDSNIKNPVLQLKIEIATEITIAIENFPYFAVK